MKSSAKIKLFGEVPERSPFNALFPDRGRDRPGIFSGGHFNAGSFFIFIFFNSIPHFGHFPGLS